MRCVPYPSQFHMANQLVQPFALTLVPFDDSRSPSPEPILSSPQWEDHHPISPDRMFEKDSPSTASGPRTGESSVESLSPIHVPRLRREVLAVLGHLLDCSLISKEDTTECVRLATSDPDAVKAMWDLVSARKTLEGKAQFLSMYLSGRQSPYYFKYQNQSFTGLPSPALCVGPLRTPTRK